LSRVKCQPMMHGKVLVLFPDCICLVTMKRSLGDRSKPLVLLTPRFWESLIGTGIDSS